MPKTRGILAVQFPGRKLRKNRRGGGSDALPRTIYVRKALMGRKIMRIGCPPRAASVTCREERVGPAAASGSGAAGPRQWRGNKGRGRSRQSHKAAQGHSGSRHQRKCDERQAVQL